MSFAEVEPILCRSLRCLGWLSGGHAVRDSSQRCGNKAFSGVMIQREEAGKQKRGKHERAKIAGGCYKEAGEQQSVRAWKRDIGE